MIIAAESVPELNARTDLPGYSEAASLDAILAKSQPVGSLQPRVPIALVSIY